MPLLLPGHERTGTKKPHANLPASPERLAMAGVGSQDAKFSGFYDFLFPGELCVRIYTNQHFTIKK